MKHQPTKKIGINTYLCHKPQMCLNALKKITHKSAYLALLTLSVFQFTHAANPDLTATGIINQLKNDTEETFFPRYIDTFNLGPTGLRGWFPLEDTDNPGANRHSHISRQILVTHVGDNTPAATIFQVDDVILGVSWGNNTSVTNFTKDARVSFGEAIGEAEKNANGGILRIKRWRAGNTSTVQLTLPIMGEYATTAPYNCPKSANILQKAYNIIDALPARNGWTGAIEGLAMLSTGENRFNEKIKAIASIISQEKIALEDGFSTWDAAYELLFLSEYYLITSDAAVLPAIKRYTTALSNAQGINGTYGHNSSLPNDDGSPNGPVPWYGPMNNAGIIANLSLVVSKKAIEASGETVNKIVTDAIKRGNDFFRSYVNKGSIPYGEHEPHHGRDNNGKQGSAAVFYALLGNQKEAQEAYARWCISSFIYEEKGHTGFAFSYIWTMLGAHTAGDAAGSSYFNEVKWNRDISRRPDGSFSYDEVENEQLADHTPADGSLNYWEKLRYYDLDATAMFILQYAAPKKKLLITGRNGFNGSTIDANKIANSLWAATSPYLMESATTTELLDHLNDFDPLVRQGAAAELGERTSEHLTIKDSLISMSKNMNDTNARAGACSALAFIGRNDAAAALGERLQDQDPWVRTMAAKALSTMAKEGHTQQASSQISALANALINNIPANGQPLTNDPLQFSNAKIAETLFATIEFRDDIKALPKNIYHQALKTALQLPAGGQLYKIAPFIRNQLTLADTKQIAPDLVKVIKNRTSSDQFFSVHIRRAGLAALAKYRIEEGIPLALLLQEQTWDLMTDNPFTFDENSPYFELDNYIEPIAILRDQYGTSAKDTIPTLEKWLAVDNFDLADNEINSVKTHINAALAVLRGNSPSPNLEFFKTVSIQSIIPTGANSAKLTAQSNDLDAGSHRYIWKKINGPGNITFSSNNNPNSKITTAQFSKPGTYTIEVGVVDNDILNKSVWTDTQLGYIDFKTYESNIGMVKSAPKTITFNTSAYQSWATDPTLGLTSGINDGFQQDPDGDGVPNLIEFATGNSPISPSNQILTFSVVDSTTASVEFKRNPEAVSNDFSIILEHSNDLESWSQIPIPPTTLEPVEITTGTSIDTIKVSIPHNGIKSFARLRVTSNNISSN